MASNTKADVVVVGAGVVGLAAVIGLSQLGKKVILIDAKPSKVKKNKPWDSRVYAITPAARSWLKEMNVWSLVDNARVNDVEAMHLWGEIDEPALVLKAEEANLSQLAYTIENQNLVAALWDKINSLKVTVLTEDHCEELQHQENTIELHLESGEILSAELLVAADGGHSFVRQQLDITTKIKTFDQTAIVANFSAERPHDNIARQWFSSHNTLALLPLPSKLVSMVWSLSTNEAGKLLNLASKAFVEQVQLASANSLGALSLENKPLAFPLSQVTAQQLVASRVVLVGDAAHQIHPMAGQGMSLGLRDVIALQGLVADAHGLQDIGEFSFLRQYERDRKADVLVMNTLTSGLDYCFGIDHSLAKTLRTWGVRQLNKHASIKDFFIKKAVA